MGQKVKGRKNAALSSVNIRIIIEYTDGLRHRHEQKRIIPSKKQGIRLLYTSGVFERTFSRLTTEKLEQMCRNSNVCGGTNVPVCVLVFIEHVLLFICLIKNI